MRAPLKIKMYRKFRAVFKVILFEPFIPLEVYLYLYSHRVFYVSITSTDISTIESLLIRKLLI